MSEQDKQAGKYTPWKIGFRKGYTNVHKHGQTIAQCVGNNHETNARLIAAVPDLLEALKELADIFPEHSMGELDAADFKDRADRIWTASITAKNLLAEAEKGA